MCVDDENSYLQQLNFIHLLWWISSSMLSQASAKLLDACFYFIFKLPQSFHNFLDLNHVLNFSKKARNYFCFFKKHKQTSHKKTLAKSYHLDYFISFYFIMGGLRASVTGPWPKN